MAEPGETSTLPTLLSTGERKWVTVLFADLVGSTGLIEGLDAEEADTFLRAAVGSMREAVRRYGGVVNGLQGDGIMALFGAPVAHEDHAARACFAALDLPGLVDAATAGRGRVRVGLHSGEVMVRSVGGDLSTDYVATGSTVHLAARMEQAATPGVPLATAATVRLAEGFVVAEPRETLRAKGFDIPVAVFDVVGRTGARGSWDARRRRELTTFVGREAELERLVGAAELAVTTGIGRMIAIEGEAGVGKSRLVHEFLARRPAGVTVVRAQTSPYDTHAAYLPVRRLLDAWMPSPGEEEPVAAIRRRLASLGPGLDEAAPALAFVADPGSVPELAEMDGAHRRRLVRDAIRTVLERASGRQPLVLVVEDLQWIDADSTAVLDDLRASVVSYPLVVVLTHRPEFQPGGSDTAGFEQIRLEPLSGVDGHRMLGFLLGGDRSIAGLAQVVLERTGGVPLFVEEAIRELEERGRLVGVRGAYRLQGDAETVDIPETVRAVIASRIDRLPFEAKEILQIAAVLGRTAPRELLGVVGRKEERAIGESLDVLDDSGLLQDGADPEALVFRHNLVREVAYEEIPVARRRELHGRVVDALLAAGPPEDHLERLSLHARLAGRWEDTARFALAAAVRAEGRSSYVDAARFLSWGLEALRRLPRTRPDLERMVDAHIAMRVARTGAGIRMGSVLDELAEAELLAAEIDDVDRMARVALHRSYVASTIGDHPVALASARKAQALAGRLEAPQLRAEAILAEAQARVVSGRPRGVPELLLPELDFFRTEMRGRHGMVGMRATWALMHLGEAHTLMGRPAEADRFSREALVLAREHDRPFDLAYACWVRGSAWLLVERVDDAAGVFEQGVEIGRRHDLRWASAWLGAFFGFALALGGELDRAGAVLDGALRDTLEMEAPGIEARILAHQARVATDAGHPEVAAGLADRAIAYAVPAEDATLEIDARRCAAAAADEPEVAAAHLRRAVEVARREGLVPFVSWSLLELADVLGRRTVEGRDAAEEANGLRMRMGLRRVHRSRGR